MTQGIWGRRLWGSWCSWPFRRFGRSALAVTHVRVELGDKHAWFCQSIRKEAGKGRTCSGGFGAPHTNVLVFNVLARLSLEIVTSFHWGMCLGVQGPVDEIDGYWWYIDVHSYKACWKTFMNCWWLEKDTKPCCIFQCLCVSCFLRGGNWCSWHFWWSWRRAATYDGALACSTSSSLMWMASQSIMSFCSNVECHVIL